MRSLFIIGNKRSGSTHLMHLLNLHPEIYITNESDIIWILYNYHNNIELDKYPHDSDIGMKRSLKIAREVLSKQSTVVENFTKYQMKLNEEGLNYVYFSVDKPKIKYLGDQKPYQNVDPILLPFILEHFPDAKFLHILRHPFEVISSSLKFGGGTGGDVWKGMSAKEIFDKWEMHENWVIKAKKDYSINHLKVRYKDIIINPEEQMLRICDFLELAPSEELLQRARKITKSNFKNIKNYEVSSSQKALMEYYSMKTSFSLLEKDLIPKLKRLYSRTFQR